MVLVFGSRRCSPVCARGRLGKAAGGLRDARFAYWARCSCLRSAVRKNGRDAPQAGGCDALAALAPESGITAAGVLANPAAMSPSGGLPAWASSSARNCKARGTFAMSRQGTIPRFLRTPPPGQSLRYTYKRPKRNGPLGLYFYCSAQRGRGDFNLNRRSV